MFPAATYTITMGISLGGIQPVKSIVDVRILDFAICFFRGRSRAVVAGLAGEKIEILFAQRKIALLRSCLFPIAVVEIVETGNIAIALGVEKRAGGFRMKVAELIFIDSCLMRMASGPTIDFDRH